MPESPVFPFDVFLSHNSEDKPRVRRLAERLKGAGVRVWLDEWVIKAGDIIALKVDEGLEQSRVLLICISPAALASGWVALERSTAVHRDPANAGRRFIPLLLHDCDLPDTLRRYKYVDFREESPAAFAEVLAACGSPAAEPPPPVKPVSTTETPKQKPLPRKLLGDPEPLAVLERKLTGHCDDVLCVAVSPDVNWVVSGSSDKTVKIWDLETGECRATFEGNSGPVYAVAITPDGRRMLADAGDGTFSVWDVESHKLLWKPQCEGSVVSIAVRSDGKMAVSAARDGNLRFWDLDAKAELFRLQALDNPKNEWLHVCLSKDERWAVSSHGDWKLRLWDIMRKECVAVFEGHAEEINSVALTPDGRYALSASDDFTVKLWDLENKSAAGSLEGHTHFIDSLAVSPTGSVVASAARDSLRLWDWKSGTCLQVIEHEAETWSTSVAFSPDGSRLIVGMENTGFIAVYRLAGSPPAPSVEATRRYMNAKIVLLGEGTVGKTSLAYRLIEDRYVVQDRTHGMNVWRLNLPLPPDATLEREALLWDLAGQEDYRLIHRLFLHETALALLLINPQKDDPFVEAGDWLKMLNTAANDSAARREARRLLVFSQVDVGEPKLGNAKIDRFCKDHGFAGWLLTSSKNGRNCSDTESGGQPSRLKQLIAGSIPWDKLPWTSTPRLLAELKNAVMAMRDESDVRLLRFAELAQRLEQALPGEKFGESDLRTAVTLLANHGLARTLKFGDLVLLRPDLINGYAGAVIRAARAHTDEIGCVLEADIYLPNFDFTGVERLKHRPDEELLLRALIQTFLDHSLCIAEDTPQGRHLVFPSQYRREKDTPKNPDVFVSYTFSGEWQTVWTTLVVRLWYSQEFAHRELWRNAAEFASAKGHTLGLLIQKEGDGAATINLYFDVEVPDELKVLFIEYVHRHLARYACEVVRDRRYICQCGKPVTDVDAVRDRLADGKTFIICHKCDEKVPFIDFIEQRLKSDPVARKILAMEEKATRGLDTQALEQILIGHVQAITGEANQIFRELSKFDYGIDGEVEFKDDDGKASGKKIYVQLKSGNSYLRTRKGDDSEVFDVKDDRHLDYWTSQPVDVYLVIRQKDEKSGQEVIRWMNVTRYLKGRKDKKSRQIIFDGEKLDMEAVWKIRDDFFPPKKVKMRKK